MAIGSTARRRAAQAVAQAAVRNEVKIDDLRTSNRIAGDTNGHLESRAQKQPKALMAAKKAAYQRKKAK
ncbi:MAG: hypothetical protein IKH75_14250 [Ruminococcus sp.]|nr:hypothetical protein [Ruminococcus sp.]